VFQSGVIDVEFLGHKERAVAFTHNGVWSIAVPPLR